MQSSRSSLYLWSRAALSAALLLLCGGCARESGRRTDTDRITVTDARGRPVTVEPPPGRVVSLLPSVTEMVLALGARDRLVGRTRYDTARVLRSLPSVGEPLDPSLERLVELEPDLVFAWDLAGGPGNALPGDGRNTYYASVSALSDVVETLADLGRILALEERADSMVRGIHCELDAVREAVRGFPRRDVAFVLWPRPVTVAGTGSYIDFLTRVAGGRNVFRDGPGPWFETSLEALLARNPPVLVLGDDPDLPSPPERTVGRPGWKALLAVRAGRTYAVPTSLFHRPGLHLGWMAGILAYALHPRLDSLPDSGCGGFGLPDAGTARRYRIDAPLEKKGTP